MYFFQKVNCIFFGFCGKTVRNMIGKGEFHKIHKKFEKNLLPNTQNRATIYEGNDIVMLRAVSASMQLKDFTGYCVIRRKPSFKGKNCLIDKEVTHYEQHKKIYRKA